MHITVTWILSVLYNQIIYWVSLRTVESVELNSIWGHINLFDETGTDPKGNDIFRKND